MPPMEDGDEVLGRSDRQLFDAAGQTARKRPGGFRDQEALMSFAHDVRGCPFLDCWISRHDSKL